MLIKQCLRCGKEMIILYKSHEKRCYCSRLCANRSQHEAEGYREGRSKQSLQKFKDHPELKEKISLNNRMRREEERRKQSEAIKKFHKEHPEMAERHRIIMQGSKSYLYKNGSSDEESLLRARCESQHWIKSVKERDNYTCQICKKDGLRGGDCNAHHIKPWKLFPELRYELRNGITLCTACHTRLHKTEEFKKKKELLSKNFLQKQDLDRI